MRYSPALADVLTIVTSVTFINAGARPNYTDNLEALHDIDMLNPLGIVLGVLRRGNTRFDLTSKSTIVRRTTKGCWQSCGTDGAKRW